MSSLILIGLPIGNTKDITLRALERLKEGQIFYAEDTRVFKKLLETLGIDYGQKFIDSFHEHSEGKIEKIVERVKSGMDVNIVSDAGSPLISDPAYPLLKRIKEEGIEIKTVPGVTSVICALELSGLPPQPFHFWGFISRSKNEQRDFFSNLQQIQGTHIFFESPHRIYETVESFFQVIPEGELIITRELTKLYESVYRIKWEDLKNVNELVVNKGEFVVLFHVENSHQSPMKNDELIGLVDDYLNGKPTPKKLAKLFSKLTGNDTQKIYDQLVKSAKV